MLLVLSPAKSLDFASPSWAQPLSQPVFARQAAELARVMRGYSPQGLAELLDISEALASLNVARYAAWRAKPQATSVRAAVQAFNGDVYDGLQASALKPAALQWLDAHVAILSGLYGVLKPLDAMQAYRLEMGTALPTARGDSLYAYWGDRIAKHLRQRLQELDSDVLVNLASVEYFKAVNLAALKAQVLECVFQDWQNGQFRVVSFFAKRARGSMARFAAQHRLRRVDDLRGFDADGYLWDKDASSTQRLVFRRRLNVKA